MSTIDIPKRVYDHSWKLDPIVRSLLDTDFYKLLMLQMIWRLHPDVQATFSLINRSRHVLLAREIDEAELREQLDHARTIRFSKKESIWLAGNTFYGERQIFQPDFLAWLAEFRLPEYELRRDGDQFVLNFPGPWTHTTMWEIPALTIISELRARAVLKGMGRFALDVLYARAKAKLWEKVERLRELEDLRIADFGTRRRHSFLWQRWCVDAIKEGLGPSFTGTSNVLLAMDHDLEAVGDAGGAQHVGCVLGRGDDGHADADELQVVQQLDRPWVGVDPALREHGGEQRVLAVAQPTHARLARLVGGVPVGQLDAARVQERLNPLIARLAVDEVEVVLIGVGALVGLLGEVGVEHLRPGPHVHLGGRGEHPVEVEQRGVVVVPLHEAPP